MITVNPYLYFNGNCEDAFNFYKSVFNGNFQFIGRYKDVPLPIRQNYFPNCTDEQIMHIGLPISKETILMGADIVRPDKTESTSNFSLYLNVDTVEEAERIFNALSIEGTVKMPMAKQFWGSFYGICLDKFGITWKISFSQETSVALV